MNYNLLCPRISWHAKQSPLNKDFTRRSSHPHRLFPHLTPPTPSSSPPSNAPSPPHACHYAPSNAMAFKLTPLIPAVMFLSLLLLFPSPSLSLQTECLNVPTTVFSTTIKMALSEVQKAASLLAKLSKAAPGFRLAIAFSDCADLLDLTADELNWSESPRPNGTGHRAADLKAWLTAALGNLDTCFDGFEGTSGVVKKLVAASLEEVSSVVGNVLKMVRHVPGVRRQGKYPSWMMARDRRLVEAPARANVTVALDGSGNFTSVGEAVAAAPEESGQRYVIYVKRGVYKENVEVKKKKWNVMLVGDGMDATIISGNRSFVDGWTTFRSATFAVAARGFIARDISFENRAGPEKHQAVALRSDSDLSAFFRCGIHGYQDTLYAHSLRQFYRECRITGTVDFIFGNAASVFQNCDILARKPLPSQKNSITAQGRKDPNQNSGFSIQNCNVTGDADLLASLNSTATYLGRPWKQYSVTVFMKSFLGSAIRPEGWLEWQGDFALSTLYYGEYMNYGPGAGLQERVKWPGYHVINDSSVANNFTVANFIDGELWLNATGVRYTAGLVG